MSFFYKENSRLEEMVESYFEAISKYNDENIVNLINQIQNLRKMRLLEKINNAKNLGVEFSNEEIKYLLSLKNAGKPQIAKIIIEKGYAEDIDSAIKKYLKYKSTTNDRIDAREVIKVVHACGGTLIIAHPYQIMNDNKLDLQSTIDVWSKLKELGADGMECYYSSYTEDEINFLLSYAKNNNLIISAGSDYHGENIKPSIKLGQIST